MLVYQRVLCVELPKKPCLKLNVVSIYWWMLWVLKITRPRISRCFFPLVGGVPCKTLVIWIIIQAGWKLSKSKSNHQPNIFIIFMLWASYQRDWHNNSNQPATLVDLVDWSPSRLCSPLLRKGGYPKIHGEWGRNKNTLLGYYVSGINPTSPPILILGSLGEVYICWNIISWAMFHPRKMGLPAVCPKDELIFLKPKHCQS